MKRLRLVVAGVAVALSVVAVAVPVAAKSPAATVCDGTLAPGTYRSLVVPAGATCDLGDGPVRVRAGVQVNAGATLVLGHEGGPPTGTISGGLRADQAAQVLVHDAQIKGGVRIQGGAGPFGCVVPYGNPCATDLEDDSISGGVTIDGYNGFWLGFIRNHVNGKVAITNNDLTPDEIDIGSNVVHGKLLCANNTPEENTGVSPGPGPNTVTGPNSCHEASP